MGFEVVGLPHYVVWHVYEPSVDDLERMEQMEREKEMKELDVENFELSRARWEQDRKAIDAAIEKMKKAERPGGKTAVVVGGEEGPVAHVGEEGVSEGQGNGLSGTQGGKLVTRENIEKE
jgi:mannan polymerase II complex ANP1 subunit